jgi:AcrR family transcriptional regulator
MTDTNTKDSTRAERVRRASLARREAQREGLRQAILDAAARLFLEQGYEAFSMRQVAERIGYSATTLYRHFTDKDELLFAVVDGGFDRFGEELAAAAQSTEDPVGRILALGHAYVRFGKENPFHYQMMFMQRADYLYAPAKDTGAPRIDSFGILRDSVDAAIRAGALAPGDSLHYANTLWALVHGIVSLTLSMPAHLAFDSERSVDEALRIVFDGIRGIRRG